jgi:hypothetical protein
MGLRVLVARTRRTGSMRVAGGRDYRFENGNTEHGGHGARDNVCRRLPWRFFGWHLAWLRRIIIGIPPPNIRWLL